LLLESLKIKGKYKNYKTIINMFRVMFVAVPQIFHV